MRTRPQPVFAYLAVSSFALAATFALAAGVAHSEPAADAAALARVEGYVAGLGSVRAKFVQRLFDAKGRETQLASGTLYIRRPGRFRWEYRAPAEQLVVSDGSTVWLYDRDLEQVTVKPIGESLSTTPAMLLSGRGRVRESFEVSDGGAADGLTWVKLSPRVQDTDFRELRLGFAGRELRRMELRDRLEQLARIELEGVERNVALADALFSFTAPPGVDVVGAPARKPH
jgi:outer membrane lipoprotein carrier protein